MTTFNTYLSLHKEIVINYSEGLPLIRIINNILIDEWVIKECDSKSTPMEKNTVSITRLWTNWSILYHN